MNRIARIQIAVVCGLALLPLASAGASEATASGAAAPAVQTSTERPQTGTQPVLRPYYVVPFFPFLWPVPPGHPAASPPQDKTSQSPQYPVYPFVIWLPAMPPATPGTPVPASVRPPDAQSSTEPAVATVQPVTPQAPAGEDGPNVQQERGPRTVYEAPPRPAVDPSPLPKGPERGLDAPVAAQPALEPALAQDASAKENARPGATPATKPKPAASRPAAAKPAPRDSRNKRKLCWKDGKLDVCK